jgi:hypothetical protein
MMHTQSHMHMAVLLGAGLVALFALIYGLHMYFSAKLTVTGLAPTSGTTGGLTISYTTSSTSDPSTWAGKHITISTKSLGKIKTKVTSATASSLVTDANAYTGTKTYSNDASDSARVFLKF